MRLLVDGDVLLYRFGWRGQEDFDWDGDGDLTNFIPDADETIEELHEFLERLKFDCSCSSVRICLSGPSKSIFRYEILPTYKHNRKDKVKPLLMERLREELVNNYMIFQKDVLEADDCLGIMSTKRPNKYVIASIDKDLIQIPGWYFNWDKMDEPEFVDLESANFFFWKQVLMGDPVDGFSGCPGIGEKRATKLIHQVWDEPEEDIWATIVDAYAKKGLEESYVLTQARVARILRVEDWDEKNQKPILWTPPKNSSETSE